MRTLKTTAVLIVNITHAIDQIQPDLRFDTSNALHQQDYTFSTIKRHQIQLNYLNYRSTYRNMDANIILQRWDYTEDFRTRLRLLNDIMKK